MVSVMCKVFILYYTFRFSPCIAIYLTCVIPSFWILELGSHVGLVELSDSPINGTQVGISERYIQKSQSVLVFNKQIYFISNILWLSVKVTVH